MKAKKRIGQGKAEHGVLLLVPPIQYKKRRNGNFAIKQSCPCSDAI
jgi:hypothetical protein